MGLVSNAAAENYEILSLPRCVFLCPENNVHYFDTFFHEILFIVFYLHFLAGLNVILLKKDEFNGVIISNAVARFFHSLQAKQ